MITPIDTCTLLTSGPSTIPDQGEDIGFAMKYKSLRQIGHKEYELTDHLGNVRLVFSDYKHETENWSEPRLHVLSKNDYYPFGMMMPDKIYQDSSTTTRFGFNGMEREDEIAGLGNSYTAKFWQYDSRTARRWNLDPRPNPSISSYGTFALNPVMFTDVMGDTTVLFNSETGELSEVIDDRKEEWVGLVQIESENSDGTKNKTDFRFEFNDPNDVSDRIMKRGKYDPSKPENADVNFETVKIVMYSVEEIENEVNSKVVVAKPSLIDIAVPGFSDALNTSYLLTESVSSKSNFSFLGGSGKLDFWATSPLFEDEKGNAYSMFTIFVADNGSGSGKGYNDKDFGNFLWGMAGRKLGKSLITLKIGAHINNIFNGRKDNIDDPFYDKNDADLLDSEYDQEAIEDGYNYNK